MPKKKKKKKKAKKKNAIKVILMTGEETAEEEDLDEDDEDESGMYLEKEDVLLIYNALKEYKPTEDEDVLHSTLFEEFEEILVVNYGVKLPGFEFMDEEEN
jgi:uncharacterized membrane protein